MGVKIEYNDNLNCLCEFIKSSLEHVKFDDLLQFAIDYASYKELYLNLNVLEILRKEKNIELEELQKKKNLVDDKKDLL